MGKATTTSWSPTLKKMIALASVETEIRNPALVADGDHDRGDPAEDECEGDNAAVLQSSTKDRDTGIAAGLPGCRPWDRRGRLSTHKKPVALSYQRGM